MITIYKTKEDATKAAVQQFGEIQVQEQVVNVLKMNQHIAKLLGLVEWEGFYIDKELDLYI